MSNPWPLSGLILRVLKPRWFSAIRISSLILPYQASPQLQQYKKPNAVARAAKGSSLLRPLQTGGYCVCLIALCAARGRALLCSEGSRENRREEWKALRVDAAKYAFARSASVALFQEIWIQLSKFDLTFVAPRLPAGGLRMSVVHAEVAETALNLYRVYDQ